MKAAIVAAGVCLHYLAETHHNQVQHIQSISRIDEHKYVWLDRFTIRNLELLYSSMKTAYHYCRYWIVR
jgi:DNA mismatch repair protein MutS